MVTSSSWQSLRKGWSAEYRQQLGFRGWSCSLWSLGKTTPLWLLTAGRPMLATESRVLLNGPAAPERPVPVLVLRKLWASRLGYPARLVHARTNRRHAWREPRRQLVFHARPAKRATANPANRLQQTHQMKAGRFGA